MACSGAISGVVMRDASIKPEVRDNWWAIKANVPVDS